MSIGIRSPLVDRIRSVWALSALIFVAICIVAAALILGGASPIQGLWDLVRGSFGSANALSNTLREVTPLLICGVAVFLALKAGLFNIGVEGQFTVGALAAAVVALRITGPLGILFGIVAGIAGGALWALPAAAIKAYRGGHEVITTIMLNNVAFLLATSLVAGPFKAAGEQNPQTAQIPPSSYLPDLLHSGNLVVSSGLLAGLALACGLWLWLKRTIGGYELRASGANATAARFAGIDTSRVVVRSFVTSGAIAGLAGAIQVLGFQHDFIPSLSSGYGFDALGVALLAGASPIGLLPSSLLFGVLNRGGALLQVEAGVPKGVTSVILGLLIVIAAAIRYRKLVARDG